MLRARNKFTFSLYMKEWFRIADAIGAWRFIRLNDSFLQYTIHYSLTRFLKEKNYKLSSKEADKVSFSFFVRGYHTYKNRCMNIWNPTLEELN